MSADWALIRAIVAEVARDDGLSDDQLAARLGAPFADVRAAARVAYRQGKLDICWGYNVLPPQARAQRLAA